MTSSVLFSERRKDNSTIKKGKKEEGSGKVRISRQFPEIMGCKRTDGLVENEGGGETERMLI